MNFYEKLRERKREWERSGGEVFIKCFPRFEKSSPLISLFDVISLIEFNFSLCLCTNNVETSARRKVFPIPKKVTSGKSGSICKTPQAKLIPSPMKIQSIHWKIFTAEKNENEMMKIITLINCLVVVVASFFSLFKSWWRNYGSKNMIETNDTREGSKMKEKRFLKCVFVIKLFSSFFFVSLLMGNKLSLLEIEAKYSPVKHFSSCGGGFACVKYL